MFTDNIDLTSSKYIINLHDLWFLTVLSAGMLNYYVVDNLLLLFFTAEPSLKFRFWLFISLYKILLSHNVHLMRT